MASNDSDISNVKLNSTLKLDDASTIPHVTQRYGWDCGLACSRMILRCRGLDEGLIAGYMKEIDLNTSVWTIDLAYILSRYGFHLTLYTLNLQVQDTYAGMSYYKNQFTADKTRVEKLFSQSDEHNYTCVEGHVSLEQISDWLKAGRVIISLVDWNKMDCSECRSLALQRCSRLCSKVCCLYNDYQGHYILLTDLDLNNGLVTYKNPGVKADTCHSDVMTYDFARLAVGTDEDLLVIDLGQDLE